MDYIFYSWSGSTALDMATELQTWKKYIFNQQDILNYYITQKVELINVALFFK